MSSSTSSSDTVAGGSRGYYLRILLTILLGMAVALFLVRAFTASLGAGTDSLLGRVLQAQAAIPSIAAEEKDLVMVFGSSMVRAGFSPREFDRDAAELGADVMSFNFGFGGLNPMFQDYVTRRLADAFEAEDRRLKLTLIEFNPFQTTITRRQGAVALEDSFIALLASPSELFNILLDDPARGLRMLEIRYLRDGISAEMITTFFWAEPFQRPDLRSNLEEDEEISARLDEVGQKLNEFFEAEYPDYDGSDWYYPWQGGGTIKSERSPETLEVSDEYYELIQAEYLMDQDKLQRIESADILDLNFDPDLIENFIAMVKNFQRISDHVEVILLPKNTDWINNPPEALARQAAALEQIRRETGVPVRDFQIIDPVKNSMFGDTTHLNRYEGAVVFTRFLAEEYADRLK